MPSNEPPIGMGADGGAPHADSNCSPFACMVGLNASNSDYSLVKVLEGKVKMLQLPNSQKQGHPTAHAFPVVRVR